MTTLTKNDRKTSGHFYDINYFNNAIIKILAEL